MAKKLHYFNLNGLAEGIRYILHYGGQEFEDIRYNISDWPVKSVKDTLPFGQLPFYQEGSKSLNQSIAIARYVASKSGLLPADPFEQALLDATVLTIYDFWQKKKPMEYFNEKDPAKKASFKKEFLEEVLPFFFEKFEEQLKANKGYFGGKISWADFVFVGIIETSELFYGDVLNTIEKNYPTIYTLVKNVWSLPKVKEYIAKRKPYSLNI